MAQQTETRWEEADGKLHAEETISPVKAKHGRTGTRILMVLIVALVLAFIVWIPSKSGARKSQRMSLPSSQDSRSSRSN